MADYGDKGLFIVDHPRGREIHPVTRAAWNLYRIEEPAADVLQFYVAAGIGAWNSIEAFDTATPWWELCVIEPAHDPAAVTTGARFDAPSGWSDERDDAVATIYYMSHELTERNSADVLDADGDRLLVRLAGTLRANSGLSDAARPDAPVTVSVAAWFERDPALIRRFG